MAGFKSEDKQLAFKVKKQSIESRNFTPRDQFKKKDALPCIASIRMICWSSLNFIYCLATFISVQFLFINKHVGVTKGRPIFPGIADLILSCVEEVDACICVSEARRWLTFVIR